MLPYSRPVFVFLLLCAVVLGASAQDPIFSQFYAAPWSLNPAMTGLFNGRWRATANYRDQWGSILTRHPFRTYSAAGEMRFQVGREDYFALGIGALHDEAGVARYSQNKAQVGGAFLKQLSGRPRRAAHYLSAGAQLGLGQNSLDWGRLWFSRQFDPVAERPDPSLGNQEPSANGSTDLYPDFGAGLLWYCFFGKNGGSAYLGGAMHHLNQPNISLLGDGRERLYSRWSAHGGAQLPLNPRVSLMPAVLVMQQGPAFEAATGLNLRYTNSDLHELALRAGLWARAVNRLGSGLHVDALTVAGMVELDRMTLGLSYDITVSDLVRANNSRGAFELSLSYIHPGERRQRVV
ncbi:MAG TPA: PorP/SprF family type IX secretion system membrane protein, partial [Myxococcota bacterium]|nr:PorP/SprF family type IX secretion system membrane protein [Myxococcota bacterium]